MIFGHYYFGEELLNDAVPFLNVFLESAFAESLPGSRVQCGLIETVGLAAFIQLAGRLQGLLHRHAAAHGDIDV
ncbi:hypothetical protein HB13667_01120 [Pseudomonas putida]|uniref:Uncharacterized protein n=1 Tax=Pseudomonas putida TaxID=303 RepID=A0A0P7DTB8_PSEPU|nr:hypothetical protein HB13667_01120 [Pseudomonas putida]RNF77349.1 hypothetical protein EFK07_31145 [Pseudomonas putida]